MTHEYNCGNCSVYAVQNNPDVCCSYLFFCNKKQISSSVVSHTYERGCLSHPAAQEALREEGAKQERDMIYNRLESLAYQDFEGGSKISVVDWSDIDRLFAELKEE